MRCKYLLEKTVKEEQFIGELTSEFRYIAKCALLNKDRTGAMYQQLFESGLIGSMMENVCIVGMRIKEVDGTNESEWTKCPFFEAD